MRAHLQRFASLDDTRAHLTRVFSVEVGGATYDAATNGWLMVFVDGGTAEPMANAPESTVKSIATYPPRPLPTATTSRRALAEWAGLAEWPIAYSCECTPSDYAMPHVRDGVLLGQPVDRNKVAQVLACVDDEQVRVGADLDKQMVVLAGEGWRAFIMGIKQADDGSPSFALGAEVQS